MTVQIVEIIGRSSQGITRPFICRAEDEAIYFVKGRGAGKRSLICEWVAGCLASRLALPIAPFEIVDVPPALIELEHRTDLSDLGAGRAFGSCKVPVVELSIGHLPLVPKQLQCDVLAFDWWIRNGDRTLSEVGGNPNLFWDIDQSQLVVLDHNQAFDEHFSTESFFELHAFSGQMAELQGDWILQQQYAQRMSAALEKFDEICDTVPPEWWFIDPERTLPVNFDKNLLKTQLLECQENAFWTRP